MAIDAGYTITAISGKDGTNGQNGASLSVQYSVNGTSNWHDTFASGDIYMRQKLGNGSWSSAMKIVGEDGQDGADGDDGTNGTNTWYSSVSATTSTTSIALSTITAVAGHSVAVGDLIIANSLVFLVSAVGSTNATVSYKQNIKGSKGDKGNTGDTGAKGDKGDKGDKGTDASQIGDNLLKNSDFRNGITGYTGDIATFTFGTDALYGNIMKVKVSGGKRFYQSISGLFQSGKTYAYSFYAKADASVTVKPSRVGVDNGTTHTITTSWAKYSGKITATASSDALSFYFGNTTSTVSFALLKLEEGSVATAWCPNSSEQDAKGLLRVTTEPTAYTTVTGGFTPAFRMSLATARSESGIQNISIGDVIAYSYNTYKIGYIDASYIYMASAVSIRGGTGATGSRSIRYIGKSATKPNSSNQTSGTPVSSVTPIVGDWYLCTTDGYVYYCTAVSDSTYTWDKLPTATDYRYLACVEDCIELATTVTTNTTLNTVVNNFTTALATGTLLANKIFTNSIKLGGTMVVTDSANHEVFRIQNDGYMKVSDLDCPDIMCGSTGVKGNITVNHPTELTNQSLPIVPLYVYTHNIKRGVFLNGRGIQAEDINQGTTADALRKSDLNLQYYGGNIYLGQETNSGFENNIVESFMPITIPAVSGNNYKGGRAKTLGIISSSLDLNASTWKGSWTYPKAYAVNDVVLYSNVYYKCKTAHTSSSSITPTNTSYWTDVSSTGYVVFSNGLKIQWVRTDISTEGNGNGVSFPISFTSPYTYVTTHDRLWIQGIAGAGSQKTAQSISFVWDTRTIKYTSIIAIGY